MNSLQIKASIAGIFFGVWPLIMNKSGLTGNTSSMFFSGMVFLFITPFAVGNIGNISDVKWSFVVVSGIISAIGLLCFNSMLSKASSQSVGMLVILMILAQMSVPAIYQVVQQGSISLNKGLGFVFAIIAAILLTKA